MSLLRKIALCFLLCLCVWLGGLLWFIRQIPAQPVTDSTPADAIVVLTGGAGRLEYGLELLAEGKGKQLFISGVSQGITADKLIAEHATPDLRRRLFPLLPAIAIGHHAENTIGNAEETVRWLKKQRYHTIRLVTANYHMPRSVEEFEELADDLTIIPAPVFTDNFNLAEWWRTLDSRIILMSEYHKFLAAKLRHFLVPLIH